MTDDETLERAKKRIARGIIAEYHEAWSNYLWAMVVPGIIVALVLVEPDLGTAIVIGTVAAAMLILGGLPWSYLLGAASAVVPVLVVAVASAGYRRRRLLAFLNPWAEEVGHGVHEGVDWA